MKCSYPSHARHRHTFLHMPCVRFSLSAAFMLHTIHPPKKNKYKYYIYLQAFSFPTRSPYHAKGDTCYQSYVGSCFERRAYSRTTASYNFGLYDGDHLIGLYQIHDTWMYQIYTICCYMLRKWGKSPLWQYCVYFRVRQLMCWYVLICAVDMSARTCVIPKAGDRHC